MSTILYLFKTYINHLDNRVWFLLLFAITLSFLDGIGLSMLMPLLESVEMDKGVDKTGWLFKITRFLGVYGSLKGILYFMFGVFLFKATIRFSMGYFQTRMNQSLQINLKKKMYQSILEVDYGYFIKNNAGHFITVLNGHLGRLFSTFNTFIQFISSLIMALTYVVMAGLISWEIAIISMVLGAIVVGLLSFVVKYVKKLSKQIAHQEKHNSQVAIQALYAFKYVVSTFSFLPIQKIYNESIETISKLNFKTGVANSFTFAFQELVTISLLILLILVEVVLMGKPIMAVFVVLLLFYRGINQLLMVQGGYQALVSSIGQVESVNNEIDNLNKFKSLNGTTKITTALNQGKINFDGIFQSYRDNSHWVLQNITLTIQPNKTIALVGPSGAGKSTLVDVLTGVLKPTKGQIKFEGVPLTDIDYRTWRSKIGYVNQDVMLFDDSLWNNISLFDSNASLERIEKACKSANIWDFIEGTEEGLETRVGDRGIRLSGGQKQRLSIARELYKNPDLLILDEATSALDAESEKVIKEAIDYLKGKMTVVIIAHRLSTIKHADKIYVMDKGRIVESGSYDELTVKKGSKFLQMVELQNV